MLVNDLDAWFDPIYTANYSRLVKVAYYILWDDDLVEDIVQNAFSALLIKQKQLRTHPNISGWLTKTVRNIADNERNRARYTGKSRFSLSTKPKRMSLCQTFCRCCLRNSARASGKFYISTSKWDCPMMKSPPGWAASRRPAVCGCIGRDSDVNSFCSKIKIYKF